MMQSDSLEDSVAVTALLVVDMQNDYFPAGNFPLQGMEEVAAVIKGLLVHFRHIGAPIIHVQHIEEDPEATFFLPNTPGVAIHESVLPGTNEVVIQKHFPNSFRNTELKQILKKLSVHRLVIVGAMTNMCIDATARAAVDFGYKCILLQDGCAASRIEFNGREMPADQVQHAFLGAFASAYGPVISSKQLLSMSEEVR